MPGSAPCHEKQLRARGGDVPAEPIPRPPSVLPREKRRPLRPRHRPSSSRRPPEQRCPAARPAPRRERAPGPRGSGLGPRRRRRARAMEGQMAGLYDLGRRLGSGHFAEVRLARHVFTGERVAVKVIEKGRLGGAAAARLRREVGCMKLVQHPNVVRLYQVLETPARLYLVLELGDGGDLFDLLTRRPGGLAEARAKGYFAQVVHAIAYCHRLHVVHRDLKPENVLFFQQQGVVKLTDFGFSSCFQPGTMLATSCGSLAYSAPEILLGEEYDAPAVDIWSLGVILYMLVCGHPPFQEANDSETLTMILDCRYVIPSGISLLCADLIAQMLQRDPKQRASLELIENHPWLQGVDPSPASRSLLPLTSHRRVLAEEHETIIQTMMCGHIADRETIEESLEAKHYNHITATYFLLAERILREKQEKQSLAEQLQSRSPPGESCPPLPTELPPATKSALENVAAEYAGKPLLSRSASSEGKSSSSFHRCGQPLRALIQPCLMETGIAKSTLALQQISEEEEEEEEEAEGKPGLSRRRTSSLNQEQMSRFQSTASSSLLFCRALAAHYKVGKSLIPAQAKSSCPEQGPGITPTAPLEQAFPSSQPGTGRAPQMEESGNSLSLQVGGRSAEPPEEATPLDSQGGGTVRPGVELGQIEPLLAEEEEQSDLLPLREGDPVEQGLLEVGEESPQTQSTTALLQGGRSPGTPGADVLGAEGKGLELGPPHWAKACCNAQSNSSGHDSLADSIIKLDPAKGKNANLKDRLLQFPLCEKALAFRMQPSSRESLLSLGQFNCCHVI
ncbi:SNF-related serine/threonine-protein kinase-like isoform X1 [Crotalus tigris]|uniref:SNF-related serine/threonine-protein kinase-like isoform X1 n=1 Tax=Crotalus tigris TaxID=88082 RepID=UPI00192F2B66|nr:SNF-related serine/threonine-protein kinase-like isoform X1 [Crotalus tigris]